MPKCPNCGQSTRRTSDWACQWCGYPLTSKNYRKIDKTYRQLKDERVQKTGTAPGISPGAGAPTEPGTPPAGAAAAGRLKFTVNELYSKLTADKEAAAAGFRDRLLVVTGRVVKVVMDYDYDIYYVSLAASPETRDTCVNCIFPQADSTVLYSFEEGSTATIEGKYDGYELNVLLKDCSLVSIEEPPPPPAVTEAEAEPEPEKEPETAGEPAAETAAAPETPEEPSVIPLPPPAPVQEPAPAGPEKEPEPAGEPSTEAAAAPETPEEPPVIPLAAPAPEPEPEPEPVPEPVPLVPDIELNISEFFAAYAADESAADARFGGKVLKLSGIVNRVELRDYLDLNYINLSNSADNILEHVRCFFDKKYGPELGRLSIGDSVTVQGTYDGTLINMRMKDCTLAD